MKNRMGCLPWFGIRNSLVTSVPESLQNPGNGTEGSTGLYSRGSLFSYFQSLHPLRDSKRERSGKAANNQRQGQLSSQTQEREQNPASLKKKPL